MRRSSRQRAQPPSDPVAWEEERRHLPPPLELHDYTLSAASADASLLADRLTFVLRGEADAPESPDSRLFTDGIRRIWTDVKYFREGGPSVMCGTDQFLAALRRLADRCLLAVGTTGVVRLPATDDMRALVSSLYPDASAVTTGRSERGPRRLDVTTRPVRRTHPALLFVLGAGRSGTTWLTRMLQLNPRVAGIGDAESWVFDLLGPLWRLTETGSLGELSSASLADYVGEFADELVDTAREERKPRATVFVEKTPGHAMLVPFLRAVYPQARYLHLIRDGRDVARSLSRMRFTWLPVAADAARNWEGLLRRVRFDVQGLPPSQFREVRYERLRADPVGELSALWSWIGTDVDSTMHAIVAKASGERVSTWSGTDVPLGADSWRSLPRHEIAGVYGTIGRTLVAEGYVAEAELRRWRLSPGYLQARARRARAAVGHRLRSLG